MEGETMRFDGAILKLLRSPHDPSIPIGPHWLLPTMRDISALGGTAVVIILTTIVSGFIALKRNPRLLLFFLGSITGGTIAMLCLKSLFNRPRPDIVPLLAPVQLASFPSGHSMISAIVYLTLGALLARSTTQISLKIYFLSVAAILTFFIGISRVYLGVHYPTDVLAGWCAGIMWACLSALVAQALQRKHIIETESEAEITTP
jgi:undecaprenyl-diphosphatase